MLQEKLLNLPGFLYEINGMYYYLGKWICKECTDTNLYFQKIRAYSDFALEVPYNSVKVKEDIALLIDGMSKDALEFLKTQILQFEEDLIKYS